MKSVTTRGVFVKGFWAAVFGASMVLAGCSGDGGGNDGADSTVTTSYNVEVSAEPAHGGNLRGGGSYDANKSVTVSASPNTGYSFVNWTENGNEVSISADYTFSASAERALVARFSLDSFSIGVTVSGLNGVLELQNNGGDTLSVTADGDDSFSTAVPHESGYQVTVLTQPSGQVCAVSNGSGTVNGADVVVSIECVSTYTVGGSVSGLAGTGLVLRNNGGDDLTISGNGDFTFPTVLADSSGYSVTVLSAPDNLSQTCNITNAGGTLSGGAVTDVQVTCITNSYTIGGTITGLAGTGLQLQNNGGDTLDVTGNGDFRFPTALFDGNDYAITVLTHPANLNQTCSVTNGGGTLHGADVTNVDVTCTTSSYTIGGTITGLAGTGLQLQNNGSDTLDVTGNGDFRFPTALFDGNDYAITVLTQPENLNQSCSVTNGGGTLHGADVTNVDVTCTTNSYTIGGTITGLAGTGLQLQNNGGDTLDVTGNGDSRFPTALFDGNDYAVTVLTQPENLNQTCSVTNGGGTLHGADVTNVDVTCTTNSYNVGVEVSGLNGTMVFQNNGGDDLSVSADGTYNFLTALADGSTYSIKVLSHPESQVCTVNNGSGTLAGANVTASVICEETYSIGGEVSGLAGSGLVLQNNGGDNLRISGDGAFVFGSVLTDRSAYNVSVLSQPTDLSQTCTVSSGSGMLAGADVTNVVVVCTTNTYDVRGRANGLNGTIVLQNNGVDDLSIGADGEYTLSTLEDGTSYSVAVLQEPANQVCTVSNGVGLLAGADATVSVQCEAGYSIGGEATGLSVSGLVLQNNAGDLLDLAADSVFSFDTLLSAGSAYNVTVLSQPSSSECSVINGTGTVGNTDVTDISVTCVVVPPPAPEVSLSYGLKELRLSWNAVEGATHYQLFEDPDGLSGYSQVGADVTVTEAAHKIALHNRINAAYQIMACNSAGCTASDEIVMSENLVPAIGYVKASNPDVDDAFGQTLALSDDGSTLAVGVPSEDSGAKGVNGNAFDNTATDSGAVYVFIRAETGWLQQAYLKASNTGEGDYFGAALALSSDGDTLAVGAYGEDGTDDSYLDQGAVYMFTRSGTVWTQHSYIRNGASAGDRFGYAVDLSADARTLVVGAPYSDGWWFSVPVVDEGGAHVFIRDNLDTWIRHAYVQRPESENNAGELYGYSVALSGDNTTLAVGTPFHDYTYYENWGVLDVWTRSGDGWSQQSSLVAPGFLLQDRQFGSKVALSYDGSTLATMSRAGNTLYAFSRVDGAWSDPTLLLASNGEDADLFPSSLALSSDGNTIAVGAQREDSGALGISGDQYNNLIQDAGAAYVFTRSPTGWVQQAYVKASNTQTFDYFGESVALSGDGETLAVGAPGDDSGATGVGGDSGDNSVSSAGAVFLY